MVDNTSFVVGSFDADAIRELLTELGTRLQRRGVEARIFIVVGAAIALAYSRQRMTPTSTPCSNPRQSSTKKHPAWLTTSPACHRIGSTTE
jgi:hypothetical protein